MNLINLPQQIRFWTILMIFNIVFCIFIVPADSPVVQLSLLHSGIALSERTDGSGCGGFSSSRSVAEEAALKQLREGTTGGPFPQHNTTTSAMI
jgi:hypothetical protein